MPPKVTMAISARLLASESAASVSLSVIRPSFNSAMGCPVIEPDVSSSNTQGTRGSGLSANSLASNPAYSIWSLMGSHLAWGFLNF